VISPLGYTDCVFTKKHDVDELYEVVKQRHLQRETTPHPDVQHPSLTPLLRPYQKEAVTWMLDQEGYNQAPTDSGSPGTVLVSLLI
jgi:hypothetical protein